MEIKEQIEEITEQLDSVGKITQKAISTFYDNQDKWLIEQMLKDMQDNPEKYKGAVCYPIEREKVIDLIKKGTRIEQLEYELKKANKRLAEQYHEIVYLNNKIKDLEQIKEKGEIE